MIGRFLPLFVSLAPVAVLAGGVAIDLKNPPAGTTGMYFTDANGGQRGVPIHPGDFDGDGDLDTAVSPFSASTLSRDSNGVVHIIFGDGTLGETINLATYTGRVLTIHGAEDSSLLGLEMGVGDFDKDGYDDLVMGSSHGKFRSVAEQAGEVVVLYGRAEWGTSATTLDIKNLPVDQRAKFILGERGGAGAGDRLGSWITVDDFDGNNELDLMMGMDLSNGPANNRANCGAAAILWDIQTSFPAAPYLRVGDPATASVFTVIYGRDAFDQFGATHGSGDLDGDGSRDLVISAGVTRSGLSYSPNNYSGSGGGDGPANDRPNAGESTIFWNAGTLRSHATVDTSGTLPGGVATTILYGETSSDYFGEEVVIENFVGDATPDLAIGGLTANGVGSAYIFPGGAWLRSQTSIDTATPPANQIHVIDGLQSGGIAADTLEIFDVNNDGYSDFFNAAPYGNVGSRSRAGYTMVIFGGQTLPLMPARLKMNGLYTIPSLYCVPINGADANDFFAYSTNKGDYDGDGYMDYVPNAMQGDGFAEGYPGAGENYILSGLTISQYASAPTNLAGTNNVPTGGIVASWTASQPILGTVVGYELTYLPTGSAIPMVLTVAGTSAVTGDFPTDGTLLTIRAKMERGAETNFSLVVPFTPPVIIRPVASPTPSPSPSPSPTPSPSVSPTASLTPSPVPTAAQQDGWLTN
ncbi:FG-GAP repeat protein [Candidatus Sumerlaeota bacterium]|nr:FG-GAP repeat protein [Candidatus Sumerlaeota bacterium]